MSRFVLVHGSWHGAWCWAKLAPLLEARGHRVETLDLAGHGQDKTPAEQVGFETYVEQLVSALRSGHGPAILVGHSLGGVFTTQAAERSPDLIKSLVYLSAYLPTDGQSVLDLAAADEDSALVSDVILSRDGVTFSLRRKTARVALYSDCAEQDVLWALSRLVPEPVMPFRTPVSLTSEGYGSVPRAYIKCLRDLAVTPHLQAQMLVRTPCSLFELDTGHSPFFSAPEKLAELIEAASLLD